jgi:hypothetical protein
MPALDFARYVIIDAEYFEGAKFDRVFHSAQTAQKSSGLPKSFFLGKKLQLRDKLPTLPRTN